MVPLPGSAIPMASDRQFIEFAVYIPEQEPQPWAPAALALHELFLGDQAGLVCADGLEGLGQRDLLTAEVTCQRRTARYQDGRDIQASRCHAGTPGTILSQLGMSTSASIWCACASVSTQSAISSRDGSEYFMPM